MIIHSFRTGLQRQLQIPPLENLGHLHLIIVSNLTAVSMRSMGTPRQTKAATTQLSNLSMRALGSKSWTMHGRVSIVASLHMGKRAQAKVTLW